MSAAKKKYTQNDLRRLMQEQKSKTKATTTVPTSVEKIDSPLAKYNEAGQLTCILCKSVVRSESVWKVHINTKNHKENVEIAKALKNKIQNSSAKKRSFAQPPNKIEVPEKKLKSILKNGCQQETKTSEITVSAEPDSLPTDFFDSKQKFFEATLNKTSIKKDLVNIKRNDGGTVEKMEIDPESNDEKLPEGFFDDPIKDAKIHNKEYKDPQDLEWDRFQKEIKEEAVLSNEIIAGEQEDSTAKRQIEEIDEQIRQWSKVLDLEKKKEVVICSKTKLKSKLKDINQESDESADDDENFDEFLDWRAKRLK